jgi:hypothetical protein
MSDIAENFSPISLITDVGLSAHLCLWLILLFTIRLGRYFLKSKVIVLDLLDVNTSYVMGWSYEILRAFLWFYRFTCLYCIVADNNLFVFTF